MDVDSGWWSLRRAEQLESFQAYIMIESFALLPEMWHKFWVEGGQRQRDFTDISIVIHLYLDPLLRADAVRSGAVMAAAQCHSWSGDKIWSFVYETEWEKGFWLLHSTCFFCGVFFLCNLNDFQSRLRKSYDDKLRIQERKRRRGMNWTNSSWHQTLLKEMIVGSWTHFGIL
jgi:hypothetical protein